MFLNCFVLLSFSIQLNETEKGEGVLKVKLGPIVLLEFETFHHSGLNPYTFILWKYENNAHSYIIQLMVSRSVLD